MILFVSLAVVLICAAAICRFAFRRTIGIGVIDSPYDESTPSGQWTLQWVGPFIHGGLQDIDMPAQRSTSRTPVLPEDGRKSRRRPTPQGIRPTPQSITEVMEPQELQVTSIRSSTPPRSTWSRRAIGDAPWIINTSPFALHLCFDKVNVQLACFTCCREGYMGSKSFEIIAWSESVVKERGWCCLPEKTTLKLERDMWVSGKYLEDVARLPLPNGVDGTRLGHLKVVLGPKNMLLIMWSPPAELRGMPIQQFERFLSAVVEHEGQWECNTFVDGNLIKVEKPPGSIDRNMYDACDNMIKPDMVCLDASYAELRTDYGPPDLFISHVWAEPAANTLQALRRLVQRSDPDKSAMQIPLDCRVWFCTCCNNQSRVADELGSDVEQSPFARVIASSLCAQIAMINPLQALKRKWCNFEFSLAKREELVIMFVTSTGVVQSGQVAPQTLHELAMECRDFHCVNATCASESDEVLINAAVERMGGYDVLDLELREAFVQAIREGHRYTSDALAELESQETNCNARIFARTYTNLDEVAISLGQTMI